MIFDKLGIAFNKAYTDKISGKNIDRPALNKLELEVTYGNAICCEVLVD